MSKRISKKLVGIITVPLSPGKKYFQVCGDSYISTAHVLWLEDSGLEVIPIPYDTDRFEWYFNQINGLYLPSGGAFASTQKSYYNCCKTFLQLAVAANNAGNYFPVWGGCMGMQQMMIIADGRDDIENFLETFDSMHNLCLPLIFTDKGLKSKLMKNAYESDPSFLINLMTTDVSLNNHSMGVSPEKFTRSKLLNRTYDIISYNYDRNGKQFVSTIEAKDYPFYGVQWHPERADNMDYFANFFATEVHKNHHISTIPKTDYLQRKKVNCMTYSNDLYKNCFFYWHAKTSAHNKKLCSVATLGSPKSNAI
jgi:gamma-glutamyl hydrolase